jgi:hypothetical protein
VTRINGEDLNVRTQKLLISLENQETVERLNNLVDILLLELSRQKGLNYRVKNSEQNNGLRKKGKSRTDQSL